MRLTVTPLGAIGRSAAGVAAAVVDYLEGNEGDRGTALVAPESNGLTGTGRYYADSIEGPGRWLGSGAGFRGLSGVVDRESFRSVLEGRHPMTGERLVTARGSSQRSHLAVGTVARFDGQGRPLYTLADAASLLGKSRSEVDELVAAGQSAAGAGAALTEGLAVVLDPVLGPLVPDGEVTRLLESASRPIDAAAVMLTGSADDELSVAQTASLLGVSARYVRRLCAVVRSQSRTDRERACRLVVTGAATTGYVGPTWPTSLDAESAVLHALSTAVDLSEPPNANFLQVLRYAFVEAVE